MLPWEEPYVGGSPPRLKHVQFDTPLPNDAPELETLLTTVGLVGPRSRALAMARMLWAEFATIGTGRVPCAWRIGKYERRITDRSWLRIGMRLARRFRIRNESLKGEVIS